MKFISSSIIGLVIGLGYVSLAHAEKAQLGNNGSDDAIAAFVLSADDLNFQVDSKQLKLQRWSDDLALVDAIATNNTAELEAARDRAAIADAETKQLYDELNALMMSAYAARHEYSRLEGQGINAKNRGSRAWSLAMTTLQAQNRAKTYSAEATANMIRINNQMSDATAAIEQVEARNVASMNRITITTDGCDGRRGDIYYRLDGALYKTGSCGTGDNKE